MAELHHRMHFWHNTEGENHRVTFPGLVTSSALSSFWHWQKPVIWMGALIAFHKVPAPVSRVQWSDEQTECQKSCLLFLVLPSPRDLGIMALPDLIPPPQHSVNQAFLVFSHFQSSLKVSFRLLISCHPRVGDGPVEPPGWVLSLGTANANSNEALNILTSFAVFSMLSFPSIINMWLLCVILYFL